jgi:hypothetical protein
MTRPGDSDVVAGGAGGMGPCPPPQHQPPGGVYTHIIHVYTMYIQSIFIVLYIPSIYNVYTKHILCINKVYSSIYKGYTIWYIP